MTSFNILRRETPHAFLTAMDCCTMSLSVTETVSDLGFYIVYAQIHCFRYILYNPHLTGDISRMAMLLY